jgi:hypothetical protein
MHQLTIYQPKEPWNKNKLVGQKLPLKLQQIKKDWYACSI